MIQYVYICSCICCVEKGSKRWNVNQVVYIFISCCNQYLLMLLHIWHYGFTLSHSFSLRVILFCLKLRKCIRSYLFFSYYEIIQLLFGLLSLISSFYNIYADECAMKISLITNKRTMYAHFYVKECCANVNLNSVNYR